MFKCTICGAPKTHYRLYGYQCNNRNHGELERENTVRALHGNLPDVKCPHCKAENTNGVRRCVRCGKRVGEQPEVVVDEDD